MALKITIQENELFDFLKMDPDFDKKTIERMLEGAKAEAETFLNTDFSIVEQEGQRVEVEAPPQVKEWVFNRVAQKYETQGQWILPDFSQIQPFRVYPFRG